MSENGYHYKSKNQMYPFQKYKHFFVASLMGLILLVTGCNFGKKTGNSSQTVDGQYVPTKADSNADAKTISNKAYSMAMNNRMDDAIILLNALIPRFKGKDKAMLLDQRGSAYFMKDDHTKAVVDYQAANELDPNTVSYLINLSESYEAVGNNPNAIFFAKKIMGIETASDSDRSTAQGVIDRCSIIRSH